MIKTREMYAGGFYLFEGKASANSTFIEDKEEAMKFICICNLKLSGYLVIHDFLLTKDGWQIIVELHDEKAIREIYEEKRKSSRKAKADGAIEIVWKIISEQLRCILSNFVVWTNKKNGRSGGKVARSYERYWFETVEEAKDHLDKMRKQLIRMSQRLRKYRPSKIHYRVSKSEGRGAIFLCSLKISKGMESQHFGEGCINLIADKLDVLAKLVKRTNKLHFSDDFTSKIAILE